jgi:hypothetical protein
MNLYTLDPSKAESVAAPTSASAPPSTPAPVPVAATNYMPPNYQYPQYQYPQYQHPQYQHPQQLHPQYQQASASNVDAQQDIKKVRDWLAWSIINIFLGGLIPGFLPLIFTLICRSNKKKNNINGARTMSTLALVFNIIITIMGVVSLVGIVIYTVVYTRQLGMDTAVSS